MDITLGNIEARFAEMLWEREPLTTAEIVRLAAKEFDWKRTTTYTVLKRLGEKGIVKNDNSKIIPLVTEKDVQLFESNSVVDRSFGGSLPGFIAAFMDGKKLSKEDADRIRKMIEDFEE